MMLQKSTEMDHISMHPCGPVALIIIPLMLDQWASQWQDIDHSLKQKENGIFGLSFDSYKSNFIMLFWRELFSF